MNFFSWIDPSDQDVELVYSLFKEQDLEYIGAFVIITCLCAPFLR